MTNRRDFLASGMVAVASICGCLGVGELDSYDKKDVKNNAKFVQYNELRRNVEKYKKESIHFQTWVVAAWEDDGHLESNLAYQHEITDIVFGRWDGKRFYEGEYLECWGVVEGNVTLESESVVPDITLVDVEVLK